MPSNESAINAGRFCMAISQENTLAVAMIIMMDAETDAARSSIEGRVRNEISR
jgi:hypothetical protein